MQGEINPMFTESKYNHMDYFTLKQNSKSNRGKFAHHKKKKQKAFTIPQSADSVDSHIPFPP